MSIRSRFISLSNSTFHPGAGTLISATTIPIYMAKSTKSPKASGFDADKFLAELEEQSRREKEAEQKREALLKEYSIPWNMKDEEPQLPDMRLNAWLCRWEPVNIEKFIREHGEECKRIIAKLNADEPTNQPDAQASCQPEHQSTKSTVIETSDNAVQPQSQFTGATAIPSVTPELEITKASVPSSSETDVPDGQNSDTVPASVTLRMAVQEEPDSVEQLKKSRISSKMVNADFDELTREFLHITRLGEKKPVFLPLELRNALETLARLSGVPNLAPSHIVINVLKAFFDEHRDLINRKLSGVKLRI